MHFPTNSCILAALVLIRQPKHMKKFMALYMAPVEMFDKMMQTPPEEQSKGMEAWQTWMGTHKAAFVDMGAPLGKTKKVTSDGSVSDVKNQVGGYSIVQANSADEAAAIFKDSPHLQMSGAWVEVVEIMQMPGM